MKPAWAIASNMKQVAVIALKKSLDMSVCREEPWLFFWNSVYDNDNNDNNDDNDYDNDDDDDDDNDVDWWWW